MSGNTQAQQITVNVCGSIVRFWGGMYASFRHPTMSAIKTLFQAYTPHTRDIVSAQQHEQTRDYSSQVLRQAVYTNSTNEMDWLMYAALMTDPAKRLYCLERALAINPENELAIGAIQKQRRST